ncbi:hypothetical protein Goarm_008780 [Gossypium armourianum]|uniref:Uncharacterized protein n=14 Tax=Gossypium TaxID=3633 RepID=A0A7J9JQY9_9ROSI|nr:hypothetical protein [Gossypium armourianum]
MVYAVGRSLMDGLRNNFSNLPSTSRETTCGSFLYQIKFPKYPGIDKPVGTALTRLVMMSFFMVTFIFHFILQQQRTFIQMRTVLKVVDNSGAKKVMCIQALKGKKGARLGDTIIASVKEAMPNGKVKKGKVVYGVVVRAAMQRGRCDGSEVKFDDNAVVLVDKQGQPIGTRVFGPVPHELRQKKHVKILTLAEHIA